MKFHMSSASKWILVLYHSMMQVIKYFFLLISPRVYFESTKISFNKFKHTKATRHFSQFHVTNVYFTSTAKTFLHRIWLVIFAPLVAAIGFVYFYLQFCAGSDVTIRCILQQLHSLVCNTILINIDTFVLCWFISTALHTFTFIVYPFKLNSDQSLLDSVYLCEGFWILRCYHPEACHFIPCVQIHLHTALYRWTLKSL